MIRAFFKKEPSGRKKTEINVMRMGIFFLFAILSINFALAYTSSNYGTITGTSTTSQTFDQSSCSSGTDFLMQIAPIGCTPTVVRSDLLEQQDVPIFCQLAATQINPLIDIAAINSVTFNGSYSNLVSGIGFWPAKSALGTQEKLNFPVLENVGYVRIVLKQQRNESSMPEYIQGNLTASIKYDLQDSLGIGTASLYLPQMSDGDWQRNYPSFGFWNQEGFLRATDVQNGKATISVYDSNVIQTSSLSLDVGQTSNKIYISGLNCLAGFSVKLNSVQNPDTRAILKINADTAQVAKGESFLNNKCIVRNLDKKGLTQKIDISCSEDQNGFYSGKPFTLSISPKIQLKIGELTNEYSLGDYLNFDSDGKSYYLAYIGTKKDPDDKKDLFVYLLGIPSEKKQQKLTEEDLNFFNEAVDYTIGQNNGQPLLDIEQKLKGISISTENFLAGKKKIFIDFGKIDTSTGKSVLLVDFSSPSDLEIKDAPLFLDNFNNAVNDYNDVSDNFASEKYNSATITLGEQALVNEIKMMSQIGQKKSLVDLCDKLKQSYPKSKSLDICSETYKLASSGFSITNVLVNGKAEEISFTGIYQPTEKDYSAKILIRTGDISAEGTFTKDKIIYLKDLGFANKGEFIQLTNLDENSATIKINLGKKDTTGFISTDNNKITINSPESFGSDYTITLGAVNLKKVAKVSVIPNIGTTGSKANFQFKIGIEKRWNVTLIPENMRKEIQILNASISTFENISNGLSAFVQAGKTACLATGAVLVVKNFAEAFSGSAIARTTVMRGAGGWNDICAGKVSSGESPSLDKCLLDNAPQIDKDVSTLANLMTTQNQHIADLQPPAIDSNGQKTVDNNAVATALCKQVSDSINVGDSITDGTNPIILQNMKTILSKLTDAETCRDVQLYMNIKNSGASDELKAIAKNNLYSDLYDLQVADGYSVQRTASATTLGVDSSRIRTYMPENAIKIPYEGLTYGDIKGVTISELKDLPQTPIQLEQYKGKTYILALNEGTTLSIKQNKENKLMIYDEGGQLIDPGNEIPNLNLIYFEKLDTKSYQNKYNNYKIKFYDTEPYKGMPAIVPFDINNGWYAATTPTLPVLGGLSAYDASGKVSSFWVCNVGKGGIEENRGGNDKCTQITGQSQQSSINGLNAQESTKIIDAAKRAIEQASDQKARGSKNFVIDAGDDHGKVNFNNFDIAANIPDVQCQDFMSPSDCAILFNVCDPFICPSSRCNLGGAYPVKDVVQSGIFGSLVLCFPNFIGLGGTDVLPICVTGVQAGIDAFISVQKSYRDCLQDALNTGRVRGICDEIHGMYLCDFFWKQAAPFAKTLIPNVLSALTGQIKGGGEYLTINSAFDNAEKSANYFVQYYGANAGTAFNTRTAEQFIGDAICKTSSSVVYPSGADFLSSITKPSSPPQFTGRFEETSFTTVTNPAISQYKVYYHIFAGKEAGAYYQVYLRSSDSSSINVVSSGYAPVGESADDTKVFTAISGYKELCISVNGQEECGFQEVSTSFAVDYLQQSYVASQVNNSKIKTTAECNSGTIPLSGLELYNQGVVRICATDNPGVGTDSYVGMQNQRWVDVGYCDTTNIKCWVDTQSVKNVITIGTIQNQTKNDIESLLLSQGEYMSKDEFTSEVDKITKEPDQTNKITEINRIFSRIFYNNQKAYAILLRGDAYSYLAIKNKPKETLPIVPPTTQGTTTTKTIKTYQLKIGFNLNNKGANYDSDVSKSSTDTVALAVDNENNCDRTEYQVYSPRNEFIIWRWAFKLFAGDRLFSGRISQIQTTTLLDGLTEGTYYVVGYCYNNKGQTINIKSENLNVQKGAGSIKTIPPLETRYTQLKSYFDKYAKQYLPTGWDLNSFKALLVAIAVRQSNLGYPAGVYYTDWLMEYGWINGARDNQYKGIDKQISNAAETLGVSLNGAATTTLKPSYATCNALDTNKGTDPVNDKRLKCAVSVYMVGINSATSIQGAEAADEVIQIMGDLKDYFNTGNVQSISKGIGQYY